jgi:hypothetical protein
MQIMLHKMPGVLFDTSKLVQRPIPEQQEFEKEYFELLKALPKIIDSAFELTIEAKKNKRPLSMNRNWFANELNGNVLDMISQSFPDFIKSTGRGSYFLYLNYKYECYIKRLTNKRLLPSYNHSKTSKRITNLQALPTEPALPIIYLGWTINKSNERITGYHAVCNKGAERIWATDLLQINANRLKIAAIDEKPIQVSSVKVTVKAKGKSKGK